MEPLFSVDHRRDGPITSILVRGELDLGTVGRLREAVDRALQDGSASIEVDLGLGLVTFLDSAGISTLLRSKSDADVLGVTFRVLELQPPQQRILEITGLTEHLCGTTEGAPTH